MRKFTAVDQPVAQYRIAGETFLLRRQGRKFVIKHPLWSLMGTGKTVLAAELDLRDEAKDVAHMLGSKAPATLSQRARDLYAFALRIS